MKERTLWVIVGLLIIFTPIIVGFIAEERIVVGEKLCVDGHGNKNLEGIMCEETESFTFDNPSSYYNLFIILMCIPGFYMFFSGLNMGDEE